jgi:restriction system protein
MIEVIAFALIMGFFAIFLVKKTTSNIALEEESDNTQNDTEIQALRKMAPQAFERAIKNLIEDMGLRVIETVWVNSEEIDILANNPTPLIGGDYLVHGILVPDGQFVDSIRVIGLSDTVRAERALKGILITTGFFTEEVNKYTEGAPMELINVSRFREIMRARNLPWPAG